MIAPIGRHHDGAREIRLAQGGVLRTFKREVRWQTLSPRHRFFSKTISRPLAKREIIFASQAYTLRTSLSRFCAKSASGFHIDSIFTAMQDALTATMKHFSGNHFEIGQQIGAYYKVAGIAFLPVSEASLLEEQLKFYERYAPELLDEWRGIARGSGHAFELIAHAFLTGEILFLRSRKERSCTIGGFTDASGQACIARNYDWCPAAGEVFQAWRFAFPGKQVVAVSDMGIIDATGLDKKNQIFLYEDAINSDGLYIGMTFAHCIKDSIGLTSFDAIRLVAWRCKTVAEAVHLFEALPLSAPKNFFIADSAGQMAVVQHGVDKFDVRYPDSEGLLALTNHYVGSLESEDRVRAYPNHTTFRRYERMIGDMRKLRSASVGFKELDAMMTSSDTPVCQCIVGADNQVQMETVWTLLLSPNKKDYRLIGNPRSEQRQVTDFSF